MLFKTIQFSISTQFNCQKNLFQTIQTVICNNSVKCKYSFNVEKRFLFQIVQLSISTQFKCKYGLIVKKISILNNSV